MPDTARTLAALQALLADNSSGDIGAQDVRDFLVSVFPPQFSGCRVTKSVPGNLTAGEVNVTWDTDVYDTDDYHDTGSNTERLTVPTTGYYLVTAGLDVAVDADNQWIYFYVRKNVGTVESPLARHHAGSTHSGLGAFLSIPILLTAGEYVSIILSASDAKPINRIFFAIHRLGQAPA